MATTNEAPISVTEFARRVGISRSQAQFYIQSGDIKVLVLPSRPGAAGKRRHLKVEAGEVGRFLERGRKAATA